VYRHTNEIMLKLEWDHKVPFSFLQANPRENWAAACNICNSLKGNLHFADLQEAREYLAERWAAKGYGDKPTPEPPPPVPRPPRSCEKCGAEYGPKDDGRRKLCVRCRAPGIPAAKVQNSSRGCSRWIPATTGAQPSAPIGRSVYAFCAECHRNHWQARAPESHGEASKEGAPHDLT
jgi:hypothetical protein